MNISGTFAFNINSHKPSRFAETNEKWVESDFHNYLRFRMHLSGKLDLDKCIVVSKLGN